MNALEGGLTLSEDGSSLYAASGSESSLARFSRGEAPDLPDPQCSDGIDNDSDGKVDFPADPAARAPATTTRPIRPRLRSALTASTTTPTARSTSPRTRAAITPPTTTRPTRRRTRPILLTPAIQGIPPTH